MTVLTTSQFSPQTSFGLSEAGFTTFTRTTLYFYFIINSNPIRFPPLTPTARTQSRLFTLCPARPPPQPPLSLFTLVRGVASCLSGHLRRCWACRCLFVFVKPLCGLRPCVWRFSVCVFVSACMCESVHITFQSRIQIASRVRAGQSAADLIGK